MSEKQNKKDIVDITPDPSLMWKIGMSGHDFPHSAMELIDNPIDAMLDEQLHGDEPLIIHVIVDKSKKDKVTFLDNASGMTRTGLINALKMAKCDKPEHALGQFGLGMKSACFSIGKTYIIKTGVRGENYWNVVYVDPFSIAQKGWEAEITTLPKKSEEHGTTIEITNLRVDINQKKIDKLIEKLNKAYRVHLTNKTVQINVRYWNKTYHCEPPAPTVWKEGTPEKPNPQDIRIPVPKPDGSLYGYICGTVGLMEKGSQKGLYGFDLYRYDRMICEYQKIGFKPHPQHARIYGSLKMDFVPVNHEKTQFLTESAEYIATIDALEGSEIIKELARDSQKTESNRAVDKRLPTDEQSKVIIGGIIKSLYREGDIEPLLPIQKKAPGQRSDDKNDIPTPTDVEQREPPQYRSLPQEPPHDHKTRTPRKLHTAVRRFRLNGVALNMSHTYYEGPDDERKEFEFNKDEGSLAIYTNKRYAVLPKLKDLTLLVAENIVDSVAEIYASTYNWSFKEAIDFRDRHIKNCYESVDLIALVNEQEPDVTMVEEAAGEV